MLKKRHRGGGGYRDYYNDGDPLSHSPLKRSKKVGFGVWVLGSIRSSTVFCRGLDVEGLVYGDLKTQIGVRGSVLV